MSNNRWLKAAVRYRMLAEEMQVLAEGTRSLPTKLSRQIMAQDYEFLALMAERRHNGLMPLIVEEKA